MLSELCYLNLKLCSKQYNKSFVLHLILSPQLSSGWRHNYSNKTRQEGHANEQSMYSLFSMAVNVMFLKGAFEHLQPSQMFLSVTAFWCSTLGN
jgi:hypothetical protein